MSDLKWLRDLGEGRTAGPWRVEQDASHGHIMCNGRAIASTSGQLGLVPSNARFIAAAGTLWEPIVRVIEAAQVAVDEAFRVGEGTRSGAVLARDTQILYGLLCALQAARKEVE